MAMFDNVLSKDSIKKRLLKHTTIPDDTTQCWLWDGATDLHGSGMMAIQGSDRTWHPEMASRLMYWITHGDFDPELVVHRFTCDNAACINPAHMKLIKKEDLNPILSDKFLMAHGEEHHFAVLNDDIVRKLRSGKLTMKQVMAMTGVTYTVVRKARIGVTWKHVDKEGLNPIV